MLMLSPHLQVKLQAANVFLMAQKPVPGSNEQALYLTAAVPTNPGPTQLLLEVSVNRPPADVAQFNVTPYQLNTPSNEVKHSDKLCSAADTIQSWPTRPEGVHEEQSARPSTTAVRCCRQVAGMSSERAASDSTKLVIYSVGMTLERECP